MQQHVCVYNHGLHEQYKIKKYKRTKSKKWNMKTLENQLIIIFRLQQKNIWIKLNVSNVLEWNAWLDYMPMVWVKKMSLAY